jgi:hypothetical protein
VLIASDVVQTVRVIINFETKGYDHVASKGGYTLVTLRRIVTPYRDNVDGTRDRVTYQKLVTR